MDSVSSAELLSDMEKDLLEFEIIEKIAPSIKNLAIKCFPYKTEEEIKNILTTDEMIDKIFNIYYLMNES